MKFTLSLISILLCLPADAQLYSAPGGLINSSGTTQFSIGIAGLSSPIDSAYGLQYIEINVEHQAVEQLHISLRSPSGTEVELTGIKSCKGANFFKTVLKNGAPVSVASTTAPYTGTFCPLGNLGRFNTNKPGNGTWHLIVEHLSPATFTGAVNGWTLSFGPDPPKPVNLTSSNLPLVFINTPASAKLTEGDMVVSLGIIDNGSSRNYSTDSKNNFNGRAVCHVRGSSSRMFEKKNLKLELKCVDGVQDTLAAITGMPAESDWILTACYTDKTLIRNTLSQELFRQMGHYTPRCRFVELILNDEYFGVYVLMEQVKRGGNRVNVRKTELAAAQSPEITGGYIVQIDRTDSPGWFSLFPGVSANGAKFFYQYNYPHADVITDSQKNYLKSSLDSFETSMVSQNFSDEQNGFRRHIDEESFIDYMILQEVSKNVDAYKLSFYLYKHNVAEGGKWHAGPAWDFDLAWHNANYGDAFNPKIWQHVLNNSSNPIQTWWKRFLEDSIFRDKLQCRYKSLRQTLLSENELFAYIDGKAEELKEARERNFRQFPIMGAYIWPNPQDQDGATYETEITDLKSWIQNRTSWLDVNDPGECLGLGLADTGEDGEVVLFPNPFSDSFTVFASPGSDIRVFDLQGHCVKEISALSAGDGKVVVDAAQLAEGIYLVHVKSSDKSICRKLVKVSNP